MPGSDYRYLDTIDFPSDIKKFTEEELIYVSRDLRNFIIDEVSINPGHLAPSLGVVELTVAIHYAFNSPRDKIIWDVGHQAYGHKILTGRKDLFHTNRKFKGISGFPKMKESEYDAFGVGHSSTSISAALGMAVAAQLKEDKDRHVVAVIGDGSLTGGMAFEALNHAGTENANLLVILNDNKYSIDPSVGALKEYLADITTSKTYNKFKKDIWNLLGLINKIGPNAQKYVQKVENAIKSIILKQSNLFEALNFRYFGPIDGHDVVHMAKLLKDLQDIPGPKLLHCVTKKGKGFAQAEMNQTFWHHAPGKFNKETGEIINVSTNLPSPPAYQEVFGQTLLELAKTNDKIIGITPAMPTGCSMNIMMDKLPERVFDVGIAEQHAVTFSAGLATQGLLPYCNIYSTFMQRAYDQIIHDVAIQNLHVVFCLDRSGLVGNDGPTHHGVFDIAFLRNIPNMIVAAPMDELDLRNMLYTAQKREFGPFAIRYPKGNGNHIEWQKPFLEIPVGKARQLKQGKDLAILTIGHVGNFAATATEVLETEGIHAAHYDMRYAKPLDEETLHTIFKEHKSILTVEDGILAGGFGSSILEFMADNGYNAEVKRLGVPDKFIEHGSRNDLYKECHIDVEGIFGAARQLVKQKMSLSY